MTIDFGMWVTIDLGKAENVGQRSRSNVSMGISMKLSLEMMPNNRLPPITVRNTAMWDFSKADAVFFKLLLD